MLRSKYGVAADEAHFKQKRRSSQIWKGVLWGAELLRQGLRWEDGNGERIFFWKDIWLGNKPLYKKAEEPVDEDVFEAKAVSFWENAIGWNWGTLQQRFPTTDLVRLASISSRSNPSE